VPIRKTTGHAGSRQVFGLFSFGPKFSRWEGIILSISVIPGRLTLEEPDSAGTEHGSAALREIVRANSFVLNHLNKEIEHG
jgi:hypothetical protein